ncbi:hypothetical protein GOP47_0013876 [Adiantum capillus-veneris]|uniref:Uncharacterized protein n=1 Tax=Adiantum capillus-veneris TaxID=13818 RepID=A0A9D4UPC6_ADICA|nr:hypothetical protein GOP47_0013876 [Adiantum capillus-veneris]
MAWQAECCRSHCKLSVVLVEALKGEGLEVVLIIKRHSFVSIKQVQHGKKIRVRNNLIIVSRCMNIEWGKRRLMKWSMHRP